VSSSSSYMYSRGSRVSQIRNLFESCDTSAVMMSMELVRSVDLLWTLEAGCWLVPDLMVSVRVVATDGVAAPAA